MMSEWNEARLGDLCTFVSRGITPQYVDEGIPVINQKCIRNNKVDMSLCRFTNSKQKIKKEKFVKFGDILVNSTGTGTLGRVATYKQHIDIISADGHVTILRTKPDVDPLYLGYYLHSVEPLIENLGRGTTNQLELSPSDLKRIKIILPCLHTQKQISNILSTYDDLIENNARRIALLEKAAEELYKEWFVRFRFPGYDTVRFGTELPEKWSYRTVGDVSAILQRGISPTYDDAGQYWVINQKCIRSNIMDINEARKQSKAYKAELNIRDGDTVICSTGTGTLGRVGQVYGHYPNTTFDSHVTLVRAQSGIGKHFLYFSLKNLQPWFTSMGIGSTNQQELYAKIIKSAKIIVPTAELVDAFDEQIDVIHEQIIVLSQAIECAIKQRDLLLPRLLGGKLEV